MSCFPISDHVKVPQQTVSFKCRPLGTCICLHSDEIYWRTSRGLYWESKTYKLKRSYVSWSSIFSCITVKWGIVQSRSHGSLPSFLEGEIACSRCSDRGNSAKRCEQKKITMWGAGSFTAYIFFSLSFSTIRTPGTKTHLSEIGKVGTIWARSIQPKFQPVRPGKEDHLKRWTRFFETFPVGPNRSIEFWTEISGKFVWMDRALYVPIHEVTRAQVGTSCMVTYCTHKNKTLTLGCVFQVLPVYSACLSYFVELFVFFCKYE